MLPSVRIPLSTSAQKQNLSQPQFLKQDQVSSRKATASYRQGKKSYFSTGPGPSTSIDKKELKSESKETQDQQ